MTIICSRIFSCDEKYSKDNNSVWISLLNVNVWIVNIIIRASPCFPTFIPSGNWISRLGSSVLRRRNFLFIFGGKCQSHYKGWNQVVFRFFLHYRLPCNYETMSSIKMVSVYYVVANHCTMQRKSRPWLNGPWRKASLLKPNSHQQNGSSANVLLINANGSMVREYYIEQKI